MEIQYFLFNISPNSSWAEWGSQFLLKTAFVPSWFAGSSWFRLGSGACLPSSLFFLFSEKGFCFIMDFLVPLRSDVGSGVCLPSSLFFLFLGKVFCSIMDFLVPPASGWGSGACLPSSPFLLALLFSRENSLYQFWTRLKIKDLHSVWIPGCVGASLLHIASYLYGWSNEGVKQKTGVCQTVPWILNCTWPGWKHALLLFGVYAGVIFIYIITNNQQNGMIQGFEPAHRVFFYIEEPEKWAWSKISGGPQVLVMVIAWHLAWDWAFTMPRNNSLTCLESFASQANLQVDAVDDQHFPTLGDVG